jgi:spoIIIJ-associated protein
MEIASAGADWVKELLQLMGYTTSVRQLPAEAFFTANHDRDEISQGTSENKSENPNYWLEISNADLQESQVANIIGQDGSVIDAIQYLANVSLNHHSGLTIHAQSHDPDHHHDYRHGHSFYTVELNNYRSSHLSSLQALTEQAVQQVRETHTEFVMKNLSAADRRYVHHLLDSCTDIENFSQGREPHRYLIVKLVTNNGKDTHTADC